jgi:Holliday junction DNA helicase RuvA
VAAVIGRLTGMVAARGADGSCVLDVGGVGYELFVPVGALARLPEPPEPVTLHVHTHVREDVLALYGFETADDRAVFRAVLGVSGVGPKLALAILGALDADALSRAIAAGDRNAFKGIPGVGKKTVERVVLELKDKLPIPGQTAIAVGLPARRPVASGNLSVVADALVQMGYKLAEAERAVRTLRDADKPVPQLLKEALGTLGAAR